MNNDIAISIVIPAYNEEGVITKVISEIKSEMAKLENKYEIIVINDGSTDNTAKELNNIKDIIFINTTVNRGYGATLKTGIKKSRYDWILIIDADGTYPVKSIPDFIKHTDNNDLVTGNRNTKNCAIPAERKHAKKFLNNFASYLAGNKIPDLNSGLRIFKKNIALKYWELFPERFSFTSTLTMICMTHGYNTKFLSIDYYKREGKSSIKATDFFNFLKLIFKLSLFFKPIKVFAPLSAVIFLVAIAIAFMHLTGMSTKFYDATFIVLIATALQTFFFGLLAEIVIHNK